VELRAPRVVDRRCDESGVRRRFTIHILPPYMRRSPKVAEVLPILYLRGLSIGDFRPALEALLGEDAAGLSPATIARLTAGWEKEYTDFRRRDLSGREYVYVWVDGIHFNIRLDDDRLCTLVMIGVRPNGEIPPPWGTWPDTRPQSALWRPRNLTAAPRTSSRAMRAWRGNANAGAIRRGRWKGATSLDRGLPDDAGLDHSGEYPSLRLILLATIHGKPTVCLTC
jgi:hypothetical protein